MVKVVEVHNEYAERMGRVRSAISNVPKGYEVALDNCGWANYNIYRKGRVFSHRIGWILIPNCNPDWGKRDVRITLKYAQDLEAVKLIAEQIEKADFDVTIEVQA